MKMTRIRWFAPLSAVILFAATGAALAHGGKEHDTKTILGTVKTVAKDKITIETPDGKKFTIALDPDTEYSKDGKDLSREAVEPGMRVAMEVTEEEDGGLLCHRVMLGMMMGGDMHDMHGSSGMHDMHQHEKNQKDPHQH
jgi:hypothetical protein